MKKLLFLPLLTLITSCAPTFQNYQPKRDNRHLRGTPRYGANTRVVNKNGIIFIIDSLEPQRKHPNQVFYAAHYENGVHVDWLPERTIHAL